jgi:hypothetical protein
MGWGIFYDTQEEMMFGENLTAQPPFGGSTTVSNSFFNTPFRAQDGSLTPNPFNGFLDPKPGSLASCLVPSNYAVWKSSPEFSNSARRITTSPHAN